MLNVEPENDTNPTGSTHRLTATLVPAGADTTQPPGNNTCTGATGPVNVDFEVVCVAPANNAGNTPPETPPCTPDPQYNAVTGSGGGAFDEGNTQNQPDLTCTIPQGQTSCFVEYTRNDPGTDSITGFVDEGGNNNVNDDDLAAQDTVTKVWQTPGGTAADQRLDCAPENPENPLSGAGSTETYNCTVYTQFGQPATGNFPVVQGDNVDQGGTNDPDNPDDPAPQSGNVNPDYAQNDPCDPTCSFTVAPVDNETGTADICFYIQGESGDCGEALTDDFTPDPDANTGQNEVNAGNQADMVRKTWTARAANGGGVDAEPETDTNNLGESHTVQCFVFDQFGEPLTGNDANTTCNFEFLQGSPSDLEPTNQQNSPGSPDRTCTTADATPGDNSCSITYTQNLTGGTDLICVYTGTAPNATGTSTGTGGNQGTCGGETLTDPDDAPDNTAPFTGDAPDETTETNDFAQGDQVDLVQKVWVAQNQAAAQTIDAEPETDTNNLQAGQTTHTLDVIARDPAGNPTTGQTTSVGGSTTRVRADILSGPNAIANQVPAEIQCTADANAGGVTQNPPSGTNRTHTCTYNESIDGQAGEVGTDQIIVFYDTNDNGIYDGANCGTAQQTGEPCDQVSKTWVSGAQNLSMTPDAPTTAAGVCQFFTVTVTQNVGGTNQPVPSQVVDVLAVFQNPPAAGQPNQPNVTFCNPGATAGPNVTVPNNNDQTPVGTDPSGPLGGGAPNQRHAEFTTDQNGQFTFGIQSTQPGTIQVTSFIDANNNDQPDDAVQDTSTLTVTAGGAAGARSIEATPTTATNPLGTTHTINVTVRGASTGGQPGPVLAGVPVSAQVTSTQNGGNPNTPLTCGTTNNQGQTICQYQGVNTGTDTITIWVNQGPQNNQPATAGPDPGEPQTTVTKTWTAQQAGFSIDVTCTGQGIGDDRDLGEQGAAGTEAGGGDATADCRNPLTSTTTTFRATVTQADTNDPGTDPDPAAGVRVHWTISVSPNNATTADVGFAPGSTPAGPNTVSCTTDASGTCDITVNNPTPANGDTVQATGTVAGQNVPLAGGTSSDTATKAWQTGQASNLLLTPAAATNQTGQNHTVTATVTNQFGQGVTSNGTVDFRVISGPNTGRQQLDTPLSANGTATFTYTSNVAGDDVIQACLEIPGQGEDDNCVTTGNNQEINGTAFKRWQTTAVQPTSVGLDMDADDPNAGQGATPPGGCELTSATDATRETAAENTINPTQATNPNNFHRICAAAFQSGQNANTSGRIPGQQITFTIQGPGRIFAADANGNCTNTAVPPAGTTLTTNANQQGIAFACLFSQQAGRTTVTASSGSPAQTATGTKDWVVSPASARFIQLCHGDIAGTTCETAAQTNEPGDEHQLTARVTDAQGNPVANVPVQFRETGPAIFTPQGGSTATVNTDANGLASVLMVSDVVGQSTVVAEISPPGTVGGFRGPGVDECEQGAGTNNQPAAGNCISQTLTKNWAEPPPEFECNDGEDNDGDGAIDFGDDEGCESEEDDSELPIDDPPRVRHERRISIRFQDGTGARNNGLVVFGRVRLGPDGTNEDCFRQVPVNVQRRVNGRWITKKTTTTNRRGRYAVEIFDQASRYRAVAPRHEILEEDLNELHVCLKAVKQKRHRHRRGGR